MAVTIHLYVTYQQVCVFDSSLLEPFNSWTDLHVDQGFSWRHGSVSFGTLDPDGYIEIEINVSEISAPSSDTIRAIVVPFHVPVSGQIVIATITEEQSLSISNNVKGILFEAGVGGVKDKYKITFIKGEFPEPLILIADNDLSPPIEYSMEAEAG